MDLKDSLLLFEALSSLLSSLLGLFGVLVCFDFGVLHILASLVLSQDGVLVLESSN